MKKLAVILLLFALAGFADRAAAQVKNDFSDWNVPPPVTPGSIARPQGSRPVTATLTITDVPASTDPIILNVRLAALMPITNIPPVVPAPDQPAFPLLPFNTPDIPLPAVPDALDAPGQAPQDAPDNISLDIPDVPVPEMPDLPKMPETIPDNKTEQAVRLPLVPIILKQPVPGLTAHGMEFPFNEWPAPAIPSNVAFIKITKDNGGDIQPKPKPIKKTQRKRTRIK